LRLNQFILPTAVYVDVSFHTLHQYNVKNFLPDRQKNGIYISLISLIYLLYLQSLKIIMASRLFHFRIRIRKDYCDYRRIFNLDLATFFSTGVTSRRI
jgi:hypothetical protein